MVTKVLIVHYWLSIISTPYLYRSWAKYTHQLIFSATPAQVEPPPGAGGTRLILFGYPNPQRTGILQLGSRAGLAGAVIWAPGVAEAEVFDGATLQDTKKRNLEIEFVKSNRWQGRDQLKVAWEAGVRGQGGEMGPIVEHWGYWVYASQPDSGVVAPFNDFWRVCRGARVTIDRF